MDFEAIWHTHKPFILKVLGGALVFLILTGVRSSIASGAAAQARKNASQQAAIQDKIAQLRGQEGLEKGRANALSDKLEPALAQTLLWQPRPEFLLPEGEGSPALFYDNARHKALSEVERYAARWNAQVPKGASGLGLREEVDPAEVVECLAWADLVQRVVTKLLDAGVRTIDQVDPGEASYQARQGDERLLREMPLKVAFSADISLAAKALAAFQTQGEFLQVSESRIKRGKEELLIELELIALSLVKERPAGAAENAGPARRPTRGPQRVRRFGRER